MMKSIFWAIALLLALPGFAAENDQISSGRKVPWVPGTNVGVRGGIPTNRTNIVDVTLSPYFADSTGATDASADIQSAWNAASEGDIIYLPAGTYLFEGRVTMTGKNNVTIRGAGSGQLTGEAVTLINYDAPSNGAAFQIGSDSDFPWSLDYSVSGSPVKGDSVLTINESVSGITVGKTIRLSVLNELDETAIEGGDVPVMSVYGYERVRKHMAVITAKGADTITISPPLPFDCPSRLEPKFHVNNYVVSGIGLEDLKIDADAFVNPLSGAPVTFLQALDSWVKNVTVVNVPNRHVEINNCVYVEMRHCYTDLRNGPGGSNGAGLNFSTNSGCLIVDNILLRQFPLIEINDGATANAFLYNLLYDSRVFGTSGVALDTNHASHNSFNLFEGNAAPNIQCDGYYGSTSDDTLFRNYVYSTNPGSLTLVSYILNRFTRNYNAVGNIFGTSGEANGVTSYGNPNFANPYSTGTASPLASDFWADWTLTGTVTSSTVVTMDSPNGPGTTFVGLVIALSSGATNETHHGKFTITDITGNVVTMSSSGGTMPANSTVVRMWAGVGAQDQGGFQELDLDVEDTGLLKANYYALSAGGGAIPGGESIGSDTLPASLAYSAKPDWFGSLTWPPYDSASPNQSFVAIPAGYRYVNNTAAYLGGSATATATTVNVGTFNKL